MSILMNSPSPTTARIPVRVFSARGKDIQWLSNATLASGDTSLTWNGKDRQGNDVPSGTYFIEVLGDTVASNPLTVVVSR